MVLYRALAAVLVAAPWLAVAGALRLARHGLTVPHVWHATANVRSALLLAGLLGATFLCRLRADAAAGAVRGLRREP